MSDAGRQSSRSQRGSGSRANEQQQNVDEQRGSSRKSGQSQKSARLGSRNADESLILQDNNDNNQEENVNISRRSARDEQNAAPSSRRSGRDSQQQQQQQQDSAPVSRRSGRDSQQQQQDAAPASRRSNVQQDATSAIRRSNAQDLNVNGSQQSLREDGVESQNGWSQIQDYPSRLSSHDRELVNKSRNDYYGTQYITDVKQYFEHKGFEGIEAENKKYLEDLLSDFRKLLKVTLDDSKSDKLHDVIFVEQPDSKDALPAHEQLLTARSGTFEALFKKFKEGESSFLGFELLSDKDDRVRRVLLPSENFINPVLVEAALHYMYWGNIDERLVNQEETLKQFFETASFLDLKELRRYLAQRLFDLLERKRNAKTSIEYLKLAVKCGCKYLKKETIDFIVREKAHIVDDQEWKSFIEEKKSIELVKEIYQRMVELSSSK